MKDLNGLRDKAYRCAVAHGWHDQEYSDQHFLCLVISELMEAVQADRKNKHSDVKSFNHTIENALREEHLSGNDYDVHFATSFEVYIKDRIEDEFADACIRLLDLAGLRKSNLSPTDKMNIFDVPFTEFMYCLCAYITNPDKSHSNWLSEHISYSLSWLFSWCRYKGIDLAWHIEQKMKYNELRAYRHGDKQY